MPFVRGLLIILWIGGLYGAENKAPSEPPVITKLYSRKPNTIFVEWKDPPLSSVNGQISGYQLYYRQKSEVNFTIIGVHVDATHKSYVIHSLSPWQEYEVYVSLFNHEYHIKSESREVLVRGKAPGKAPTDLRTNRYLSSIMLNWTAVPSKYLPDEFDGYQIYYHQGVTSKQSNLIPYGFKTLKTEQEIVNLEQGKNYSFAVAAKANFEFGPMSDIIQVETLSGPLPAPEILKVSSPQPKTVVITWKIDSKVLPEYFNLLYKENEKLSGWETIKLDKNLRSYTLQQLKPWHQYVMKIILIDKALQSSSVIRPVLVVDKQPGKAPDNFRISRTSYISVVLAWGDIKKAYVFGKLKGYVIRYNKEGDVGSYMYKTIPSQNRNVTIKNLTHNTVYHFAVAGSTDLAGKEFGAVSKHIAVKTLQIEPPKRPTILSVQNLDSDLVLLKWYIVYNKSLDLSTSIKILQENLKTGKVRKYDYANDVYRLVTKTLTVEPYSSYRVRIKLCYSNFCSQYSEPYNFFTMEGKPSKIENIKVTEFQFQVNVSWSPPRNASGIIRKYSIVIRNKNRETIDGYPINVSNKTSWLVLKELPPYENLKVEITAYTSMPGDMASKNFISPQGKPGPPSDVNGVTINDDKIISVRWQPPRQPNGVVLDYMVMWTGSKHYDSTFKEKKNHTISNENNLNYRIKNLVPGTQYKVEVLARTVRGFGEPFELFKRFYTPVAAPIAPPLPTVDFGSVTSSSVIIRFKPARQINGQIYSYQFIVEELGNNLVERRRRLSSQTLPANIYGYQPGSKLYITAEILFSKIANIPLHKFKIGSQRKEEGYVNQPLKPETSYKLYIRATTKVPSKGFLYGSAVSIDLPKTAVAGQITGKVNFPIGVLIGIVFGIIIIIVAVVVIACFIRRRRLREKDKMNPIELGLISVQQHEDDEFDGASKRRPASLTGDYPVCADHPPIPVSAFPKVVSKLHRNDNLGFHGEYEKLEIGKEFSWDVAHLPENKPKNRYTNIVAYDHSRVILTQIDGIPGSDYINASYIDAYKMPNAYISTQGPLPNTFVDFWRMIWEVRSSAIVMLTNLQEKNKLKCHKYWPDDRIEYGDIAVKMARKEFFADFTIRVFKLEKVKKNSEAVNEVREVRQFHFTCWPEHGVPKYPTQMINFRKKVRSFDQLDSGPTVVHCSAGVGRSGAYIALDTTMERAKAQGDIDIFNYIASIRTRRIAMVQTEDQYVFVHDAVLEAVMTGDTHTSVHDLRATIKKLDQIENDSMQISGFEKQWKTLNHASPVHKDLNFTTSKLPDNMEKNRYSTAVPVDTNRVLLEMMNNDESTSYINAAYVDSYKQRNTLILTQSPLPQTENDFWRMLCEHGSTTLVMLNSLDEGPDFVKFWPDEGHCVFGPITVECLPSTDDMDISFKGSHSLKPLYRTPCPEIVVRNYRLTDTRNLERSIELRFFQYIGWTETRVPNSYRPIVNLLTRLEHWKNECDSGPITIVCSDGVGRSGTLAAIMYTLERVKSDQIFDAFQAIKSMRIQRPHVVKKMNQYKYIYFAVQEYLSAFEEHTKL